MFDLPRTITMRFRKPRKLGAAWASWLRVDGLVLEWTAATWRYFPLSWLGRAEASCWIEGESAIGSAVRRSNVELPWSALGWRLVVVALAIAMTLPTTRLVAYRLSLSLGL